MLDGVQVIGSDTDSQHIKLRVYEGEFVGCEYYYDKVTFADEPNDDGTITLGFEYVVTNGFAIPKDRIPVFERFVGDNLYRIIEESVEKNTAVYKGGTGGTLVE